MKKFMFFIGLLVSILVAQGQSVTISTNPASPIICNGQGIALTANAVAGFPDTYAWSNGANTQTISVSPNATATYTVTITFDDGSKANASQQITVTATPSITVTAGSATTFCQGGSVVLTCTTPGAVCQWYQDGLPITGATTSNYTASIGGDYTVYGTVGSCSAWSTATTVIVNPLPVAAFTPAVDGDECAGSATPLTASLTGNYSYQWYMSANTINASDHGNPIFGATAATFTPGTGDFHYSLEITNLTTGCKSTW